MSNFSKVCIVLVVLFSPLAAWAQGKIAVINLEEAILQTDEAQERLEGLRKQGDYAADKGEFDRIKQEREDLIAELQKDIAVMSQEQQQAARKKLANKEADLQHLLGKLQKAEREIGAAILQEMTPKVQLVLRDLIQTEGIGLLLQRSAVIHADAGFSLTAKVTDKLNQNAAE
ncbi:MAG: outer membrane protein [Halieaceae bacterium]